jgi:pimeloyl-ACP methyl ester carboxylesterase/membrane-associated phospholipid phosphatase
MRLTERIERYWHGRLRRPYQLKCPIDTGKGQVVVLLHGIASSGQSWKPVIDELDLGSHRVIALDLLGFGTSPQPNWLDYSIDDHSRSVMATLKRKGVRKPFILVGHSMGSLVAAEIAQAYPKKVKHLVLHQMPTFNPEFLLSEKNLKYRTYRKLFTFVAEHPSITLLGARSLGRVAARLGGFSLTKDNWYSFEMSLKNTILQKANRDKHELSMPTDVIYGKYDVLVLRKNAREYFAPSPHLRFYQVNDIHRTAARSGKLIAELIEQNTAKTRTLSRAHDTLVTRFSMNKNSQTQQKDSPVPHRRLHVLLAAFAGAGFLATAYAAYQRTITGWELQVFQAVNIWDAPQSHVLLARVLSDAVWAAVVIVAAMVLIPKTRVMGVKIAIPTVITYGIGYILEHIINRGRPDDLLPSAIIRGVQDGPGFTSGHMLAATAIAFVLWPNMRTSVRVIAVLLLVLEAWARVFLGLHFPLDVIGGVLLALAVGFALRALPAKIRTILRIA